MSHPDALTRPISFGSDNSAGASPEILAALNACNTGPSAPYGADEYSERVQRRLCDIFECDLSVLLVSTGSAANALCLSVLTPPWGKIFCHRDSHIQNDECGAPEFYTGGAKLVVLEGASGKLDLTALQRLLGQKRGDVHSMQPACVSISQATEVGSIYALSEIAAIGQNCRDAGVRLHMDGARFANALVQLQCSPAEMTWKSGVDALSLGATKNGAMSAEAIVLFDRLLTDELSYRRKRGGHLSSKMRYLSAQFDAYLEGDLWLRNAQHANDMAQRLEKGLALAGILPLEPTQSNILFCQFRPHVIDGLLSQGFRFYHDRWAPGVARLVTSFATTAEEVDLFVERVRLLNLARSAKAKKSE